MEAYATKGDNIGGVDFGRDGSTQNVGAFPGRDCRCAEEHGKWVYPGRECLVRVRRLFPRRILIVVYWTVIVL